MSINNIWDLAIEHAKSNTKFKNQNQDSVLLVLGNKHAGKTSICYKFVEKNDVPRPTLALEYSFARRSRTVDLEKDVCHIWELGGSTVFKDLITVPITEKNLLSLCVVLVLDLSVPEEIWFVLETLLSAVGKQVEYVLATSRDQSLKASLEEQMQMRIAKENVDEKLLDPFPVPLLILGSKYDLFQELESEKRKLICKCLRYLAYIKAAHLQFVTNRVENLMNKVRISLSHMVFGTAPSKGYVHDYNKPLHMPFGSDSFKAIGPLPDPDNPSVGVSVQSLETVKECFVAVFPQIESEDVNLEDPAKDPNFREADIDLMREQKDKELEEFRKQKRKLFEEKRRKTEEALRRNADF